MDVLDRQQQKPCRIYFWTKAGIEVKGFNRKFLTHRNTTCIIIPRPLCISGVYLKTSFQGRALIERGLIHTRERE